MRTILAAAVFASLVGLSPTVASAQGISIGPGGVRVETDRDRRFDERRYRGDRFERRRGERFERRGPRCRVEVERRRNRFGEIVTRRTRICR
jgi:hypothetical protein